MVAKTNIINLPTFLKGIDAIGEVSISLTINSQPSASYQLASDAAFPDSFIDNLTKYNIYSCYYRVQNATETIDGATSKHLLNVSLEGWYRPLLEKQFVRTAGTSSIATTVRDGGSEVSVINGGLTRKTTEPTITSLGQETSEYANEYGFNIVYDTAIRFGKDGTNGSVVVHSEDVLDININHKKEHVSKFILLPQYLEYGEPEDDTSEDAESKKPVFEVVPKQTRTVINDPDNAASPPVVGTIKTLDMNFDISGETKIREVTTYEGEKIISKSVTTYGYAYQTDQAAQSISEDKEFNGDYADYWRVVEDYTIQYLYDDNYYIGYDKTGWKLDRFDQETGLFELLEASTSSDQNVVNEAAQYKFRKVPIIEYERLDLEAYYNYYKDALPSVDELYIAYEKYNERTRTTETVYERNKEYIIPMFVKRKVMYSRCFDWIFVPTENADYKYEVKTCGEERKELYNLEIRPSATTNGLTIGVDNIDDAYDEYNEIMSAQDANFKNHIKNVESTSAKGRPGDVEYFQSFRRVEKNSSARPEGLKKDKYIISAGVSSSLVPPSGGETIDSATSIRQALTIVRRRINNQRKFDNGEFTITTFFNEHAKPNQKLMVYYDNRTFVGTVKNVNHQIKILGKDLATGLTTITASIANHAPISLSLRRDNSGDGGNSGAKPNLFIPIPAKKSHVDEAKEAVANLPSRGKF